MTSDLFCPKCDILIFLSGCYLRFTVCDNTVITKTNRGVTLLFSNFALE